jgi:hypothetical protein
MPRLLLAGGAAAALLVPVLAGTAHGAQAPDVPPSKLTVSINTINGSGCKPGSAAVAVSADNTAFTVTYSNYLAQVGLGAQPTDLRKNCQLNLNVNVPSGFTYAVASVDYRGYAHLEKGAAAVQKASYYFQGSSKTHSSTHEFAGQLYDNWQTTDRTEVAELVWAPCGEVRNFNINTELRVDAGTSNPQKTTSFMAMDSTDGAANTIYRVVWKECP